ncbi:MAG: DUF1016 family protein [Bacteroidales bacterium]|nr:DUF1016 family protein [Bacteroidales bacterium]
MNVEKQLSVEEYNEWKQSVIEHIKERRMDAVFSVNTTLLQTYWEIGMTILKAQKEKGWGAQVIDRLSCDLECAFGKGNGFSVRNLKYMRMFAAEYPDFPIVQVPLAQSEESTEFVQVPLAQITWYHHISLLAKVKDLRERAFYIQQTVANGWSRDVMLMQVNSKMYEHRGKAINNFSQTLPVLQSDLAKAAFKDPYHFGFLDIADKVNERAIEDELTEKISDFLLELGKGFAFVGRQYHLVVANDDYYVDLLMYHTRLHCYVVIELKAVEFIPEFVSKLNFYISVVDDTLKTDHDNPTIGLLLCRTKNNIKAEYALRGMTQPLGIAEYDMEKIYDKVKSSLPSIEELENSIEDL